MEIQGVTGPYQQEHWNLLFHHTGEQTHPHLSRPPPPPPSPHSERGGTDFCHAVSPSCSDRRSRNLRWGGAFMRIMPRWAPGCCNTSYPPLPRVHGQSRYRVLKNPNTGQHVAKLHNQRPGCGDTDWSQTMFTCSQTMKNALFLVGISADSFLFPCIYMWFMKQIIITTYIRAAAVSPSVGD